MSEIRIAALSLETGKVKYLMDGAAATAYHPTGHLIYLQERRLMAAPFDPGALEITGPVVQVTEKNMEMIPPSHIPILFALSAEGTLVYAPGSGDPGEHEMRTLVWVDREGKEEPLEAPPRPYKYLALSPDGTHAAILLSNEPDIWILDLTRKPVTLQRLTFDLRVPPDPVWMPDSRRVVFRTLLQDGTWSLSWKAANGTGPVESLYTSENLLIPQTWSADGRSMLFLGRPASSASAYDIWTLSLDGEPSARPLMAQSYDEQWPEISPDGRWLAYISNESDQMEVYIRPFPNIDDGKWLISSRGGARPFWGPDGRELYYYGVSRSEGPQGMMVVTIETEPAFAVGNPDLLFEGRPYFLPQGSPYDISPDGKRFLMIKEDSQARKAAKASPTTELIVVDNWDEVLKGLAPVEGN
jgi:Tol biopolymer transport system component